ncbi:MAG: RES family NAD+ phosphorylase [Acidobacteriota bacterium]
MSVPEALVRWKGASRMVPSRYPVVGLLDRVADPADLDALFELESWTNDRISAEVGLLHTIPPGEWVTGRPMASVVMAAFCHPRQGGSRFSTDARGAWYAARSIDTALAECIYHRTLELADVGGFETRAQLRVYIADFHARFHDIRGARRSHAELYDPLSYAVSQRFGREVLEGGGNGIVYESVRHPVGECLACFRPPLVSNVRAGGHYELRWSGRPDPEVRKL